MKCFFLYFYFALSVATSWLMCVCVYKYIVLICVFCVVHVENFVILFELFLLFFISITLWRQWMPFLTRKTAAKKIVLSWATCNSLQINSYRKYSKNKTEIFSFYNECVCLCAHSLQPNDAWVVAFNEWNRL